LQRAFRVAYHGGLVSSVLIVDDSLTVRKDLEEAFGGAGFEPTLCSDLRGAREALSRSAFSVVVLDILLPDGDGLELLSEMRSSRQHAETPVLLLSTEAEIQQRVRGLQMGANEFVGKPYDRAQLVARARNLLREPDPRALYGRGPVLVVDDSLTAREELRTVLELAGFEVVTAASGEEGLLAAAGRRPSAAVVDGIMPGMDGASFIRQLRADAALRSTPCILLTASGAVGELPALEAGADAYVLKDEGHAVVLARLQALVKGASPRSGVTGGILSPKRIVAVEDGEAPLREITARLRQDGHDVVLAGSPAEALQLMSVDTVDCVLLDEAAVPSPLEACRRMKSDPARRNVPLLLVGAGEERQVAVEAINAGADDYVTIASGPEVLRARIRAQLRRKQFEDENRIRETYARNSAILESISDAFFALDRDWRFVYVNHALEALLGATRCDLIGSSLWDRGRWLAAGTCQQELRRAADERRPVTFEAQSPGRWFEVRAFPREEGLSAHVRDVSERRRSQEVQRHLVGIAGHDLRTPLTAIAASAAVVLRDPTLPDKHRRALGRVASGAARMTRLINDLLDYSRTTLGQGIPVSARPMDLDEICRAALDEVRTVHPGREVEYRHEGDGTGTWDPDRIEQVVVNLLNNALRYGEGGRVELAWKEERDRAVVSVHNEGPSIDPALLEDIFEPFKRGDVSGTPMGGVGLGLYIVKEIALAHGGAVAVRSEEGMGTRFTLTLPRRTTARP
jgi:PAS domain S-box-containing protein